MFAGLRLSQLESSPSPTPWFPSSFSSFLYDLMASLQPQHVTPDDRSALLPRLMPYHTATHRSAERPSCWLLHRILAICEAWGELLWSIAGIRDPEGEEIFAHYARTVRQQTRHGRAPAAEQSGGSRGCCSRWYLKTGHVVTYVGLPVMCRGDGGRPELGQPCGRQVSTPSLDLYALLSFSGFITDGFLFLPNMCISRDGGGAASSSLTSLVEQTRRFLQSLEAGGENVSLTEEALPPPPDLPPTRPPRPPTANQGGKPHR